MSGFNIGRCRVDGNALRLRSYFGLGIECVSWFKGIALAARVGPFLLTTSLSQTTASCIQCAKARPEAPAPSPLPRPDHEGP